VGEYVRDAFPRIR